MKKLFRLSFALVGVICMVMAFSTNVGATAGGYTPGSEGVMAASIPPPGFHYRMYNVLYQADTLTDENGDEVPNGFDVNVLAQAHRLVWITKWKLLGADYGISTIIPFVAVDLTIGAAGLSDGDAGLGDIFIEPLVLAWHTDKFDVGLGLGANLPTGDFEATAAANRGTGMVSGLLTFGATYYFDQVKSWSGSILTRTLVYGEQEDTDITPGSEFIFDWGVGKQFPASKGLLVRPGIAGYSYWQVSEDDGPGASDAKGTIHAIGAEVNLFWLPPHLYQVNLRVLGEFGAEDESEGVKAVLTLTKSF